MKCNKCGHEIADSAKVCSFCGTSTTEPIESKETEVVMPEAPKEDLNTQENTEPVTIPQIKEEEWYYAVNGETNGPYSPQEMQGFFKNNTIHEKTYVWVAGMKDWEPWEDTVLANAKGDAPKLEQAEWYYVDQDNSQVGPFEQYAMVDFISNGRINSNTYVWKTGMQDWIRLQDSELNRHVTRALQRREPQSDDVAIICPISKREIVSSVILSIVTCGIYMLYWTYCIANDSNTLLRANNRQEGTSGGMVLLLSIVTCGIYTLYFYWKVSKSLAELPSREGHTIQDNSIITLVLGFVGLGIVSLAIIQDEMNRIIANA